MLDLWIHTIYNDRQVQGSELEPVVYFRNATGNPLTNFNDLALRWGISKATVSRILSKLQDKKYLSLVSFAGRHGSVIYLCSYLSTMFGISDVMIDKEEISMSHVLCGMALPLKQGALGTGNPSGSVGFLLYTGSVRNP